MTFDPFDAKFNTVPPKPGTAPVDTGDKTKTPTVDTSDKTKTPAGTTTFSPDSVFDDAYNLVPKTAVKPVEKDKPVVTPKPETPFDPKYNQLNKVSDFPVSKEPPRPFNVNGEGGKLFIDEKTGFVNGMQFTDGDRKGQKYAFDRDAQGNITKMHILMPGKDAATPPQYLSFQKTDKGWVSKPEGQLVPGFKNLKVENGVITGDFKVNAKGDFGYESADKQVRSVLRINGDKDHYDMREYSRETELKNGTKSNTFWNGYDWLPGQRKVLAEGVIRVDFEPKQGQPTSMIRDSKNNGFKVEFSSEKTQYSVANWKEGKMTRQIAGEKADTLYTTGAQDAQGKLQWRKGQEKAEGDKRVVTFNDAQDTAKVRSGELPQSSIINPKTGEVVSVYSNGTQVAVDDRGAAQKIIYANKQQIDILRDANSDFRGFRRSDGTTIYRGVDLTAGPGGPASTWTLQRPSEQPITINGVLKHGNAGAFSILNAGNEGLTVTPEGVMSTKIGGKITSDAPRPGDTKPVAPKDAPPPVQPTDKAEAPKPTDARTPGKAPITDEQLKALAGKYKIDPKLLAFAKARAERQGLHQTFTLEGLDKVLQLADKHKLLADFGGTADMSSRSRDGAIIGRLLPELLIDPNTAIDKANKQTRESMAKSLQGAPEQRVKSILDTIDRRYASLKTNTQPFITELAKELANRPAPPVPTPTPVQPK